MPSGEAQSLSHTQHRLEEPSLPKATFALPGSGSSQAGHLSLSQVNRPAPSSLLHHSGPSSTFSSFLNALSPILYVTNCSLFITSHYCSGFLNDIPLPHFLFFSSVASHSLRLYSCVCVCVLFISFTIVA